MILEFLQLVGPAGHVLIGLSVVALYLSIKNMVLLTMVHRDFRRRFARIENGTGNYRDQLCGEVSNPLIDIIASVVKTHGSHSDDLRAEVAYLFHRNFEKVNRGITFLRLIAVIAPLLGLLGTVLGMVSVFKVVAQSSNADSALLAGGIWEALLTTVQGLCIAIPTLAFYYMLSLRMKGFHIEAIEHSYRALERFKTTCPLAEEAALHRRSADHAVRPPLSRLDTAGRGAA
ncbi:Biopolymer transport protein ExbB/TolQ [Humidesulfovibrio mexicanus]|uniref:Biopolymer transport protein ExbB/TolQ n=1 Tax=Humidesulfovibrio mexicanus TaxID=147047 RepID=A0A239BK57_9BACT|nr:MotA/TolQ/ExbB proton channel family protein [Humidesulfovibrio mexicanus]SNS07413.1 Biopolymer transport protein ExbB/TolQ [Humidesulfovibrio mexicanus]